MRAGSHWSKQFFLPFSHIGPHSSSYRKVLSNKWNKFLELSSGKVAIVVGDRWNWPSQELFQLWREVERNTPANLRRNPLREDVVTWCWEPKGHFSIRSALETIRHRASELNWHRLVWFSGSIPRHSFILWLAIRGRLSTQRRLRGMGVIEELVTG